ncbi:MAG: C10 family peptidase [Muribaculaceae bacterium]|nr:C10 family peptidase [Muribaculaceae bacterium]
MRNRRNILMVMCLLAITTVWAGPVGERQARKIAEKFMSDRSMQSTTLKKVRKAPMTAAANNEKAAYYVFNADRGGYVIVAGDDRAPAVLGYSDNGTFDNQDVPEAMQVMLDGYAAQLTALEQGAKPAQQLTSGRPIKPLVKSEWSQNEPYNTLFPVLSSGRRAVVGCVATALAQVMYYWKWPAQPTRPIAAYTSNYLQIYMPELTDEVVFNWDAMQNNYETSDIESDGAKAVATLSLYCAQALQMDFYGSSSGASSGSISSAAATYFDYDASAHLVSRTNYSAQDWADLLYSELVAGRPVIYSASKHTGGHAFICDGYDGNGMFHINWGWNGSSNGYFLLNVLNPDAQGTGSASGAYGYIMEQEAVVGFQPDKGGSSIFEISAFDVALNSCTSTRTGTNVAFMADVSGKFQNNTPGAVDASFGWGLFDENGDFINNLYSSSIQDLPAGYFVVKDNQSLSFGAGISSGTYRIMPMYSELGQTNWRPCAGSDVNYIEVTIDGNQCTAIGYGTAGIRAYNINDITFTGTMHNGRPVNIEVNMTNNGQSSNELLYMLVDGQFAAAGYVGLEPGETGTIPYSYLFNSAGTYTLTWSWSRDGSDPIATRNITINPMPAASLSASIDVLNTDGGVIASKKFSVLLTITNNGATTYDEDISMELLKHTSGNSGSVAQGISQHLTLEPGATKTMQFDMTNVSDGWQYFAFASYYSEGEECNLASTAAYTIVFPEEPAVEKGNVNGDEELDVDDVLALVDIILGKDATGYNLDAANVNGDEGITIADVVKLVKIILSRTE